MIDPEIQRLLDQKQDKILTGIPVPQDGEIGDLRPNLPHGGKVYLMMKSGEDTWLYSGPFTPTPVDYLRLTGGRVTGLLVVVNDIVLPKTSGRGIKVDTETPTFGWRDLLGDVIAKNTGGSKPSFTTYRDTLLDYQFGAGDEEYFKFHIPHDYVPGTDIFLHIHWSHIGTFVTGGTIDFLYEISYSKGHNQAAFGASVDAVFQGTASTTQYQQIITEVQISAASPSADQIDSDNIEPDGVIIARLELNGNDITVSEGVKPEPFIHYVDIHYQSTNIATKEKAPDFYV